MGKKFAVIGGSQAYSLMKKGLLKCRCLGPVSTPFGPSQPVYELHEDFGSALFLSRHGEKGYSISAPFVNYRANIYALKELGAGEILSWSGPGALNLTFKIGQLVIVHDMIDETRGRESTFFKGKGWGFIRQGEPFCPRLRARLKEALSRLQLEFADRGVYVCTQGPRLETPSEVKKYRILGGELVGMTLSPEAFLARELEMCYGALCYVSNYAEGVEPRPLKPDVLMGGLVSQEELKKVDQTLSLFPKIVALMSQAPREQELPCHCPMAMKRYRDEGIIGEDWHQWIGL